MPFITLPRTSEWELAYSVEMKVGRATTRCRESREANMDHHDKPVNDY
jgi:hypothetical protein